MEKIYNGSLKQNRLLVIMFSKLSWSKKKKKKIIFVMGIKSIQRKFR